MSQYLSFYIRSNADEFIPLQDFSRATPLFQVMNNSLSYGKIKALTRSHLKEIIENLEGQRKIIKDRIAHLNKIMEFIKDVKNELREKLNEINCILREIDEYDDELDDVSSNLAFLKTLDGILINTYYDGKYDKDKFLYAGIECGDPSIENIDA